MAARRHATARTPYTCHLKRLRQARGWTQADVAQALRAAGLPVWQSDISRLEHGKARLSLELVVQLLKVFGVEFADLITMR